MRRARTAPGALLISLLVLSGCGWISSSSSKSPAEACPSAVILRPLAQTAVFGLAPERRPDNVAFYGILSEADLKCEYAADAMRMTLDVVVAAERGPAAKGDSVDFQYVIAVTTPDQSILYYKRLPLRIVFDTPQKRVAINDHIEDRVPLGGRKGIDLTVNLGFQQSPEAVDFYKRFRGR